MIVYSIHSIPLIKLAELISKCIYINTNRKVPDATENPNCYFDLCYTHIRNN